MSLLINIPDRPLDKLLSRLSENVPADEIEVWPNVKNPEDVKFALVWKHQHGSLNAYQNLTGISSFGAGVDSILSDPSLPEVPVARIVDPDLARNMASYILSQILSHKLRTPQFVQQQKNIIWKPKSPRRGNKVGILGLGQLGVETARTLLNNGFRVSGWSRNPKVLDGIECFAGDLGLKELTSESDYLVCLLPLTSATENILNKDMFLNMPNHAVVLNVARGRHLVDEDLIWALDNEHIDYAFLDVFRTEPLSHEHPFWQHQKIQMTPHVSAVTNIDTAVLQVVENYQRNKQGLPLLNTIDRTKGY